jgi:hypothetical protein
MATFLGTGVQLPLRGLAVPAPVPEGGRGRLRRPHRQQRRPRVHRYAAGPILRLRTPPHPRPLFAVRPLALDLGHLYVGRDRTGPET